MSGGPGMGASFDPERIAALRARADGATTTTPSRPGRFAGVRQLWARAAVLIAGFVALLYGIEGVDSLDGKAQLDDAGIHPSELDGLWGILWAPVLHHGWDHLLANTLPVLVLGFLVLIAGILRGLAATAIIWVVAGLGTWLTGGSGTVHLGASALVFGWLTFLILRGWFARNLGQIVLGLVVLACYGSLLWGVLPGPDRISWQGHLFGAVGGVVAARTLAGRRRGAQAGPPAAARV